MKVFEKEDSHKGKRLLVALNRRELWMMYGLTNNAFLQMPNTPETVRAKGRLRNMRGCLKKGLLEIEDNERYGEDENFKRDNEKEFMKNFGGDSD